jgi:S-formylglutathione hydrolase FrmB
LYRPPAARGVSALPLVILLHGVYGSHWSWAFTGGAHRTLARLIAAGRVPPMALCMPSDGLWGDGSGYVAHATQNFERWIVEEVPAIARRAYPEVTATSPVFIAGLSMGGFAALRLAGRHPSVFRAASGHSSVTNVRQLEPLIAESLVGWDPAPEARSVLASLLAATEPLPPLRFDCGTEDFLLEENRTLHRQVTEAGIAHGYEEAPGAHEWPYWSRQLERSLLFFADVSGDARAS